MVDRTETSPAEFLRLQAKANNTEAEQLDVLVATAEAETRRNRQTAAALRKQAAAYNAAALRIEETQ